MDQLLFRKRIRRLAARLGILRPLRAIVFRLRGCPTDDREIDFLRRFLGPDSHVFDVGANRGQSSENYIKLGAKVTAFEPQEDLHPEIRQLCRNSPRLTIVGCGLGRAEENRRLFVTAYDQVASLREDWEGERIGEKTIRVSTLDRQIEIHGMPDYCKIDVEGWEREVLLGLGKAVPIISFEYHLSAKEQEAARDVLLRIAALGSYHCNIRTSEGNGFHLKDFIPLGEFLDLFPAKIDPPLQSGYGDIYCFLQPAAIRGV